jgi:F-type H+-transporting ATPase subunit epsilon
MANAFSFELVSPERLLLSSDAVTEVSVPGAEGYFAVLANHAPFMSTVKPGIISVKRNDGQEARFVVFGGFADVTPAGCTILAESATPVGEYDAADLEARLIAAKEAAASIKGDEEMAASAALIDSLATLKAMI